MRKTFTFFSLLVMGASLFYSCETNNCRDISGNWTNREGRELVFNSDGHMLWLTRFGQLIDTVSCVFALNCKAKPATIDISNFSGGPYKGKTLFGILEWNADSLFRICFELGKQPNCRPSTFDPEHTMKFYR